MSFYQSPYIAVDMEVDGLVSVRKPAAVEDAIAMMEQVTPNSPTTFLEMERNAIDIVLSFLTLEDYSRLCRTSKSLNAAVYESSHLFVEDCGGLCRTTSTATLSTLSIDSRDDKSTKFGLKSNESLPSSELQLMLNRFLFLKQIHLHGLAPVGDDLIRVLNDTTSANHCTSVSLHGLALSYWCPHSLQLNQVQHLTLSGNSIRVRVSSLIRNLGRLQSLTLKQCPGIRDEDIHDIGRVSQGTLQELNLHHVKIVQPLADFPNLQRASFLGCFGLKDLSFLRTPQLTELNISFCVRLSGEQIQCIVEQVPLLEVLIMMKCNGVKSLGLSSSRLRQLDATFTHNLEVLRLSCPKLEKLETHCCSSLEDIVLDQAASLPKLNLSGSFRLRKIQVFGAQNLTYLSLRGCRNLQLCHFDTPQLQCANVTGARTVALRFCKYVRGAVIRSWSSSTQSC